MTSTNEPLASEEYRPVRFTQFVLPNGRQVPVEINRPANVADMADEIRRKGFRFECEKLGDGTVSLTIGDDDGDHDIELANDGPGVLDAVDNLIARFHARKIKKRGRK